jgi:predicted acyltransferase
VASLVTGLFFWCFVVPGIVSVILGYLALEQIADSGGLKGGRGMAITGIVLGWIGIGILGLGVLIWVLSVLTA